MAETGFATQSGEDSWQIGVTVPLWAAGIDGNTTVQGQRQDVHIGFDQLKDHLDAAFSLGVDARKGNFGLFSGVGYMKFSADGSLAGGEHGSTVLKFLIVDAGASYRLLKAGKQRPFVLEATAGVRYWYMEDDLNVKDTTGSVILDSGVNRNLVDPMVGFRGSQFLTAKLHLDFQADIGGFGISDNQADLDWSATGVLSYDLTKWFTCSAGYKALGLDVSRGSGDSKYGVDIIMHGLLLAAKFKF